MKPQEEVENGDDEKNSETEEVTVEPTAVELIYKPTNPVVEERKKEDEPTR